MTTYSEHLEHALRGASSSQIGEALRPIKAQLSLPDINRLVNRLRSVVAPVITVKLAIVRTYAVELLRPYWMMESLLQGLDLQIYEAPFGALFEEAGLGAAAFHPDVTYFCLRWEDLDPRFSCAITGLSESEQDDLAESAVEWVFGLLSAFRRSNGGLVVFTLLPSCVDAELGQYDAMAPNSERAFREMTKRRLAKRLKNNLASVYFEDLDMLCESLGRTNLFDMRLWHLSRYPFSTQGALALIGRLISYPVLVKQTRIKVIVLDADNTMWGGILGEDGIDGIAIGPDYPGSVFVSFQRRLLHLQERGILLAICSKNNAKDVANVLRVHPHQVLREKHFAALRVNWEPKTKNLMSIAEELNLGLDSFVFVDDSPHECLQVQEQLPQVLVVQTPSTLVDIPGCLEGLPRLQALSLTQEDKKRTNLYVQEQQRKKLAAASVDHGQYLQSLEMVMSVTFNEAKHVVRIAQLTQKTNQFNLTTHRYLEAEILRMVNDPDYVVADFSLTDVFGESGIVGVAIVSGVLSGIAEVEAFLMSCRVIGRGAETVFLRELMRECVRRGIRHINAQYFPTPKNALVKEFWSQNGFQQNNGVYYAEPVRWSPPVSSLGNITVRGQQ